MFERTRNLCAPVFLAAVLCFSPGSQAFAQDAAAWRVTKSSGEVWTMTSGVQQASLTNETLLKSGDSIRTGRNGRVLLTRGEETILVAPNSIIALPADQKDGLSTTIVQQAGSVLIQAEKRNVKHFQVETPYLAAVVKGTQFRVSLNRYGANVEVLGGQVEVTDFKTGRYALVLPGQSAKVSASGRGGLSLSGAGKLDTIKQGTPRSAPIQPVPVPKGGLAAPAGAPDGKTVRALGRFNLASSNDASGDAGRNGKAIRITAPLGEMNLNVLKATDGLARGTFASSAGRDQAAVKKTIWNTGELSPGNGVSKSYGQDNSNSNAAGNSNAGGNGNGNGNGNGAGNGNGNSASNSIAIGNGNGNGNGNGKAKGKGKS